MDRIEAILNLNGYPYREACKDYRTIISDPLFKWEIANFHLANHKGYSRKCRQGISQWEELPVIRKVDIQGELSEVLNSERGVVYRGSTSGSSGHPMVFSKDKYAHAMTYAAYDASYRSHGIDLSMRQARFYGIPLRGLGRFKEQVKDIAMNRVRFPVFDLSDIVLDGYLERLSRGQFDYVYGYSSSILLLSKHVVRKHLVMKDLMPRLKAVIVTSEMCSSEDVEMIRIAFGVRVLNEYGASEIGLIALTDNDGAWRIDRETVYVEVVNDAGDVVDDGQVGRILVTSLFNRAMPFIRYEIGDMGSILRKADKDVILELTGRTNDWVILPSGRRAAGLTFYYVSRQMLATNQGIKEFIIRQVKPEKFIFEVVSETPLTDRDKGAIRKGAELYLEPGLDIEIVQKDRILRPASGKIKQFYSEL
jgi:phenylacetate-CoA ligase